MYSGKQARANVFGACLSSGERIANLGHHASPSNDLRVNGFLRFLLVIHDCPQQTVEVLVCAVIVLHKGLVPVRQISPQQRRGRIIPLQGRVPEVEIVLIIVGEAGELLCRG